MKYLLVEPKVKSIAPNIALMKWATWCERNNHEFEYVKGNIIPSLHPDVILMSCIFSFYSRKYGETIRHYRNLFPKAKIIVGGAFPSNMPEWFEQFPYVEIHHGLSEEIESLPPKYSIDKENKKIITYASRGCVNKCGYCTVPKLEGDMKSFQSIKETLEYGLKEIPDANGVVLYDNNFTAHEYFDNIIDELRDFGLPVDIHGLHVSDFTEHHAQRFAELKWGAQHENGTAYNRFSFDFVGYEKHVKRALELSEKYKIKAGFFCYLLFNWKDSPHDFWKRIVLSQRMVDEVGRTVFLFPQRFEPLNSLERNKYIGDKWNDDLVRGVVKLYTFLHGFIPLTTTRNIFRWIGYSYEEFLDNSIKFSTVRGYRLDKKSGEPPSTDSLYEDMLSTKDHKVKRDERISLFFQ